MQLFHKNNGKNSMIIFFSGWALDFTPFAHLFSDEHDLLFVWDYRTKDFEFDFSGYEKIYAAAFSYGVFISQFAKLPKIESFTAINGTLHPISKEYGINPRMFDLTLKTLNEKTLEKFYQNMFSDPKDYEIFKRQNTSKPDIEALKAELETIKKLAEKTEASPKFTGAVISQKDRIIPTAQQNNFWTDKTPVKSIDCGHFPFYTHPPEELIL